MRHQEQDQWLCRSLRTPSNLHHFPRQNRTKITTFLSPSYILIPDCWWTPDSPGKTHTFEEEVQLKRSMTNSIYTSLQLLSVRLTSLPSLDTSPAMFCRLQFIDQRWFLSSLSCQIAWLDPYHESWKFQICGNMANELRNNLRKLPWDNKEEVWFVVLQCKHSSSGARGVLNAFCAYGECSISFQIWWLGTYKTGTLLNH